MGAFVSKEGCRAHYNVTLTCAQSGTFDSSTGRWSQIGDIQRGEFDADPDIAGIGVE
jgi:hypothetical protein